MNININKSIGLSKDNIVFICKCGNEFIKSYGKLNKLKYKCCNKCRPKRKEKHKRNLIEVKEKIDLSSINLNNKLSYIIYKISFPNNKVYIGLTKQTLHKRIINHIKDSNKGVPRPLYNAIRYYGNNINITIIDICRNKNYYELCEKEKFWIDFYKSNDSQFGYNCTDGGEGTEGRVVSLETRKKISNGNKNFYKNHKIVVSQNTIEKVRQSRILYFSKKENRIKQAICIGSKPFLVFKKDTLEFIGEWISKAECAKDLNLIDSHISNCIKGKRKQHKGYIFIDKEEYTKAED